ncbi:uracil-DNA glycosylase [Candidatus Poribacteria bacterium]|nr:uracil-DNA glycosylase [Candidatus Poribacteria bacterium]
MNSSSQDNIIHEYIKILSSLRSYLEDQQQLGFTLIPKDESEDSGSQQKPGQSPKIPEIVNYENMEGIRKAVQVCERCQLCKTRKNVVFGTGDENAKLVFVGEAPGEDEDLQGKPFVGRAGQKLTQIIEAMGLKREQVYITNVLKCRPPGNRNPLPEEIKVCEPFLINQLKLIKPKIICALGTFSAQTLLRTDQRISLLRGRFHTYQGIKVMPTYHPAYLLRNPKFKRDVWEDVQKIMAEYGKE